MKFFVAIACSIAFSVTIGQEIVGSYEVTVTETVSGNRHTENVGILKEEDVYMMHRALGDTVSIEEGFKVGNLYCFREFKSNGWLTVCRIDGDELYGMTLNPDGFEFQFTSGTNKTLASDGEDVTGIYKAVAASGKPPEVEYESVMNIYPDGLHLWAEQDFDGDENAEFSGFGLMTGGVLVLAMDAADGRESWTLNAYEYEDVLFAQGRWMNRAIIGNNGRVEEASGWESLEFIEGFDQ